MKKAYLQVQKKCLNCGDLLILKCNRDVDRKKFCSKQCNASFNFKKLWKTEDFKKKMDQRISTPESNAKKGRKGQNHSNWKGGDILCFCKVCNKEFLVSRYRFFKEKMGKFCSKYCMRIYQKEHPPIPKCEKIKIICKVCKKEVMVLPHRKHQRTCSARCSGILGMLAVPMKNTSIEKKIAAFLDKIQCSYTQQDVVLNLTRPDFKLDNGSLIYADGDYWHSLPSVINRDSYINKKLGQANIKFIRIPEYKINNGEFESILKGVIYEKAI